MSVLLESAVRGVPAAPRPRRCPDVTACFMALSSARSFAANALAWRLVARSTLPREAVCRVMIWC